MERFSDIAIQNVGWGSRRIEGYAPMTATMYMVLDYMFKCHQQDFLFIDLCEVHGITIRSLMERDWIVESHVLDEARYKITTRGIRALKIYSTPIDSRRHDGICPTCGKRPRRVRASGVLAPYCRECERGMGRRRRKLGLYPKNPGICPRCNKRPKHITASGTVRSYCLPCRRKINKKGKKRWNAAALKRIENGEVLLCYICHEKPREVVNGRVRDYCPDCRREYMNAYNRKRRGKE